MLLELNKITIKNRVRLQYILLVITGQSSISVAMSMSTPIHHYNWREYSNKSVLPCSYIHYIKWKYIPQQFGSSNNSRTEVRINLELLKRIYSDKSKYITLHINKVILQDNSVSAQYRTYFDCTETYRQKWYATYASPVWAFQAYL